MKQNRAREQFLFMAHGLSSPQSFYPAHLAIAKAEGKRPMQPRAPKRKRGKK